MQRRQKNGPGCTSNDNLIKFTNHFTKLLLIYHFVKSMLNKIYTSSGDFSRFWFLYFSISVTIHPMSLSRPRFTMRKPYFSRMWTTSSSDLSPRLMIMWDPVVIPGFSSFLRLSSSLALRVLIQVGPLLDAQGMQKLSSLPSLSLMWITFLSNALTTSCAGAAIAIGLCVDLIIRTKLKVTTREGVWSGLNPS